MPRVDAQAQDRLHRGADLRHSGLQDVLHALAVHVRHLRQVAPGAVSLEKKNTSIIHIEP